jgi:endonuclease/exonuclease/phosphatase family metal-dependent hydrolase
MFIEPPDMHQSWIDDFEKEIDYAKESGMEVIILGDINIDYTGGCTNNQWANMIQEQFLSQIIDTPTRVTSSTYSIIDHVYVSHPEHVAEISVPIIAISDHYPVNGSMFNS